jgi:hypothetical protein
MNCDEGRERLQHGVDQLNSLHSSCTVYRSVSMLYFGVGVRRSNGQRISVHRLHTRMAPCLIPYLALFM